jgi:hypothetical protein
MIRYRFNKDHYGKLVLIGITLLIWLLIIILFKTYGYEETWELWIRNALLPPFMDFRLIPGSAESFARGFEPTVINPFDPQKRLFNYPAFWRLFFYTGITQADSVWISVLMIILFFVGVFLFPENLTIAGAIGMLFVAFSPASMLLYERGNVDLIVFFVCVMVVLTEGYSVFIAAALLTFGIIIKLFPFFGVSVFLRESRTKFIVLFSICTLVLLSYMYITSESVNAAWNLTMRGEASSYGTNVFVDNYERPISRVFARWFSTSQIEWLLKYGPLVGALSLILMIGIKAISNQTSPEILSDRNLAAFRMGASIYVGTFLLGNNWDYRLAFLILAVPQLFEWARTKNHTYRNIAIVGTFFIMVSCWHFAISSVSFLNFFERSRRVWFIFDEACNWLLFMSFTYLIVVSLPSGIKDQFSNLFPKRYFFRSTCSITNFSK